MQNRKPCHAKDSLILENLLSLKEFREADLVLTYNSFDNEIDTQKLIKKCFEMNKRVAIPKTYMLCMTFYEILNLEETVKDEYGIQVPNNSWEKAQINSKTFCVVPALACDKLGFRIGYGKGYYDRFLSGFTGTSAVLCYTENVIEIPVEGHDRAVDLIITEGGIADGRQNRRIRIS